MTGETSAMPGTDLAGYLTRYPNEIAFGDEEPATVLDRCHTPDFTLTNDGVRLDRERLLGHVRPARKNATSVRVEVHDAVTDGDRVAARYTLTAVMRRGQVVATEVFRRLSGPGTRLDIRSRYDERHDEIALVITNRGTARVDVTVTDRYSSRTTRLSLRPGATATRGWWVSRTRGWYDLVVTVHSEPGFEYRYAGT